VSTDNLVEIRNLSFSYGKRSILKVINLTAPRGKVIAIMGGSGSGKTTLLRLIGGQLRPSGGEVLVEGQDMHQLSHQALFQMRRKMGMLFQFGALFTDLSVFENVAFQMREHTDFPESVIRDLVLMKLHAVGLRGASQLMPVVWLGAWRWQGQWRWIQCSSCMTSRLPGWIRFRWVKWAI
jgi:phospholipid/cholesterol/gamma-HCH transport system ATP-binding protein